MLLSYFLPFVSRVVNGVMGLEDVTGWEETVIGEVIVIGEETVIGEVIIIGTATITGIETITGIAELGPHRTVGIVDSLDHHIDEEDVGSNIAKKISIKS